MTKPRPEIIIGTSGFTANYNGVLEKPRIILTEKCPEDANLIGRIITHETLHWVLHKHLGEDISHFFDRIADKVDPIRLKDLHRNEKPHRVVNIRHLPPHLRLV